MKEDYKITVDWKEEYFCGLNLDWNYQQGHVDISMDDYIIMVQQKLQDTFPRRSQLSLHKWTEPMYNFKTPIF